MWNQVEYALNDSRKTEGQLEELSDSKVMQSMFNGRTFKYLFFWGGMDRFHMLHWSYKFSHGLCLNNLPQVLLIHNQIYQVIPSRYIIWDYEVSHLVRGLKVKGDMKYLMGSVKLAAEAVGIWTEDNWDMRRVNLLYTLVSGRFIFKINHRFDSLSWSSVVRHFTQRGVVLLGK